MSRHQNQVNLIFAGSSNLGKQLKAYLESLKKSSIAIDVEKTMPSQTVWAELAQTLSTSVKSFIDETTVEEIDDVSDYSEKDWIKVIEKNPSSFKGAIITNGNITEHVFSTTALFKHMDVDSAGLNKTFHTEDPTTKKTSDNDNFIS
ncbi:hypothetical protein [Winogradskyella sp. A3E31]|uniref:hypothetical protein n=1 Tax=Winogradskyella sp. A3E31 TaxID=3349637 RepID=UPI00398AF52A